MVVQSNKTAKEIERHRARERVRRRPPNPHGMKLVGHTIVATTRKLTGVWAGNGVKSV